MPVRAQEYIDLANILIGQRSTALTVLASLAMLIILQTQIILIDLELPTSDLTPC